MPVSGDRAAFKKTWPQNFDPDEENRDQHDHNGHNRVHRDAQRAVVGVGHTLMRVRHLRHGKKSQQDHARSRNNREGARP